MLLSESRFPLGFHYVSISISKPMSLFQLSEMILREIRPNELPKYADSPDLPEPIKPEKIDMVRLHVSTFNFPCSSTTKESDSPDVEISESESELINHTHSFDPSSTSEESENTVLSSSSADIISTRTNPNSRAIFTSNKLTGSNKSIYRDRDRSSSVQSNQTETIPIQKTESAHNSNTRNVSSANSSVQQAETFPEEESDDGTIGHILESSENEDTAENQKNSSQIQAHSQGNLAVQQFNTAPANPSRCCILI